MSLQASFRALSLTRFLEEIDDRALFWIVKRLSGNDTNLTGGHQSGLYLPRAFFEVVFPEICTTEKFNPDGFMDTCYIPQADLLVSKLRAIYYNSKYFPDRKLKKKYDEFRLTRWGGRNVPLQDPENTGSVCVLAVEKASSEIHSVVWVAANRAEEDLIEDWLGEEVEPGRFAMKPTGKEMTVPVVDLGIPPEWLISFPGGREIFRHVMNLVPRASWARSVDELLLKRRDVEYRLFEEIERKQVLPEIGKGFETVDSFIKLAHSVSNRRKSRAGMSLELNLATIFMDEKLSFETQTCTEKLKKPDFIFPSGRAYHDKMFPTGNLHMLAAKTCCKDRWRQVIYEADRIAEKHLFTLQQGVSGNQLQEMQDHKISLVVPKPFLKTFPREWRSRLLTLESFVSEIRKHQEAVEDLHRWTL